MGRKKKGSVVARGEVASAKKRREKKAERRKPKKKSEVRCGSSVTAPAAPYSVEDYMAKVEEYMDSFQMDMAVKFCKRALELSPNNLHVLDTMAPLLLEVGQTDRALELFQRTVSLSPEDGYTKYLYLGQIAGGEEAVGYLSKGIEIMTRQYGMGKVGGGACEEGDDGREELSSAYCALAEVYLTDACFESGADERCWECCCKAIEMCPSNPEAHQLMASCLLSQQHQEKAKEALMKGLALWLPSYHGKGEVEREGEDEEMNEAGPVSEKEVCKLPSYVSRVSAAKLLLELEEYDLAGEVLEGLLQEDDEVVGVWYLMGWLHYLTKDADSARFYLEQMQTLYTKLCCDEKEMMSHAVELLKELGESKLPGNSCPNDEEEEDVQNEDSNSDTMDMS